MSTTVSTDGHPLPGPALRVRWIWAAATALAVGAALAFTVRDASYTGAVRWAASSGQAPLIELVAEKGLLALVALTAALALWTFLRARQRFWTLVCAGAGVIMAYALSEGIKILVAEPRPCTGADLATVVPCPAAGDWSWPSNHAVLAAAFATACLLTVVRVTWLAVPLAVTVAASRVLAGVHYVHDVLAGLTLGTLVVAVTVTAARPLLARAVATTGGARERRGDRTERQP